MLFNIHVGKKMLKNWFWYWRLFVKLGVCVQQKYDNLPQFFGGGTRGRGGQQRNEPGFHLSLRRRPDGRSRALFARCPFVNGPAFTASVARIAFLSLFSASMGP